MHEKEVLELLFALGGKRRARRAQQVVVHFQSIVYALFIFVKSLGLLLLLNSFYHLRFCDSLLHIFNAIHLAPAFPVQMKLLNGSACSLFVHV